MRRPTLELLANQKPGMARFSVFLLPLFFIFLADGILAFTFPIFVERTLGSATLLGLVMGLSSVAGILCDLFFPSLLRRTTWRTQLIAGIALASLFTLSLHVSIFFLPAFFAILASVMWGIYYEMLMFAEEDLVVREESRENYTRSWGMVFVVAMLMAVFGSILGAQLVLQTIEVHTQTVLFIQSIGLVLAVAVAASFKRRGVVEDERPRRRSALKRLIMCFKVFRQWKLLIVAALPAVVLGVMAKWVEATFWTLGGLFGTSLDTEASLAWVIIVFHESAYILGALILMKLNIASGKKRWSQWALLAGGLVLCTVFFARESVPLLYGIIFLASFLFSFAVPLNEAVFSDLINRLRQDKLSLVGLAKATTSIAYIFSPITMGFLADSTDYYTTFAAAGAAAVVIGALLLVTTPRKLLLPQTELEELS